MKITHRWILVGICAIHLLGALVGERPERHPQVVRTAAATR